LDDSKESVKKTSQNISLDTKPSKINLVNSQSPRLDKNINQNTYKLFKLENIKITSKQATIRANHFRVNYLDKYQNSGFFFLDSYFRDKKEMIQPNLVGNFLLSRGYKYQFYLKTY
jgi:hypothetical protein